MVKVVLYRNANGALTGFEVSGHAGYAETGQDIVCAAVSILTTTAVNSLEEQLPVKPLYKVEETSGYLDCLISQDLTGVDFVKAQAILRTLEIGLKSIEQEYDEYIKILQRRWTKC